MIHTTHYDNDQIYYNTSITTKNQKCVEPLNCYCSPGRDRSRSRAKDKNYILSE